MKRMKKSLLVMALLVSLFSVTAYADSLYNNDINLCEGIYVGCTDYGEGFVGYEYISYVDNLSSIRPYTATQGSGSKNSVVYQNGTYAFTITQSAVFIYGSPDEVVRISSKQGYVSAYNANSPYRAGTITNTSANGSPAYVKSSFGIYKTSDSSLARNASCIMYCKNSGLVE